MVPGAFVVSLMGGLLVFAGLEWAVRAHNQKTKMGKTKVGHLSVRRKLF